MRMAGYGRECEAGWVAPSRAFKGRNDGLLQTEHGLILNPVRLIQSESSGIDTSEAVSIGGCLRIRLRNLICRVLVATDLNLGDRPRLRRASASLPRPQPTPGTFDPTLRHPHTPRWISRMS